MKINVIATGSQGNLYEILDNSGNALIVETGMPRLYYTKHKICEKVPEMCVISHHHSDHAKYLNEFKAVIPTYIDFDTCESESFKVKTFDMKHGDKGSQSFLIQLLKENTFVFFGTDFESGNYPELFQSLRYYEVENYLIECNYNDYLFHLASEEQRRGCVRHLSDNQLIEFIRKASPRNPKIITIHGSDRLSADTYTKKHLSERIKNSTVCVSIGARENQKNVFTI